MNLTESSDVATVLQAAYIDRDPDHPDAIAAARRLAERTRKPLGSSGRKYVRPSQIEPRETTGQPSVSAAAGPQAGVPPRIHLAPEVASGA